MSVIEAATEAILREFPEYNNDKNPIVKRKIRRLCKIFVAGMKYKASQQNSLINWHPVTDTPDAFTTIAYECYDSSVKVAYIYDIVSFLTVKNAAKRWMYLNEILSK